jgi:hypothetical protein
MDPPTRATNHSSGPVAHNLISREGIGGSNTRTRMHFTGYTVSPSLSPLPRGGFDIRLTLGSKAGEP